MMDYSRLLHNITELSMNIIYDYYDESVVIIDIIHDLYTSSENNNNNGIFHGIIHEMSIIITRPKSVDRLWIIKTR